MNNIDIPCVFIVDDDEFILRSIKRLFLNTSYRTEAYSSGKQFLEHADVECSGCLILDVSMPEMHGLDVQLHLQGRKSLLPIIFLTGNADVPRCVLAMKRGACDFFTKPVDAHLLLAGVEKAIQLSRKRRSDHDLVRSINDRLDLLTRRERQVIERVVAGHLNKQIAAELGMVEHTVKLHRASIMRKMQAQSVQALVTAINTLRLLSEEPARTRPTDA